MKRSFFIKLTCFFLSLLLLPLGYFFYIQHFPAMFRGSLMGSVEIKLQKLQQTEGNRIILVGGSSVPYAIECETLSAAAGMPCISMGATAYLGIEYYLALIDDELREGDIVLLAPEFSMLQNAVSYSTTWSAVENSTALLKRLPLSYLPHMVTSFYQYARSKMDLYRQKGAPTQTALEQYTNFGFGEWGDITTPRTSVLESGYDKNNLYQVTDSSLSPEVVKAVSAFSKKAQAVGAKVYLTWAPFDRLAYTGTEDELRTFEQTLRQKLPVPYVGTLTDCLLPEELFFDSNNHLTSEGAALRTQMLIEDCKAAQIF